MNAPEGDAGSPSSAKPGGAGETSQSIAEQTDGDEILSSLADTSWLLSMVFTGGGTGMIGRCFGRSGASKNFVEGNVPYSREAVVDYLGEPQSGPAASIAAAEQLASRSFERASRLSGQATISAGLSLVAALPTYPPRRGSDRVHVSLVTECIATTWSVELPAGQHTRQSAEEASEQLAFLAISTLIGMDQISQRLIRRFADAGITVAEQSEHRTE